MAEWRSSIWVLVSALCVCPLSAADVIDLGSRRELFVDRYLFPAGVEVPLRLHEPRDEGIVVKFEQPWEGPHSGYVTIVNMGERIGMYYRGISKPGPDGSPNERTCFAESRDGIHWKKPDVGIYEFNGSKANNIVLADAAPVTHNFCPMFDSRPGEPASRRYKAVGGTGKTLFAYVSEDGLHWTKLTDKPILGPEQMGFRFTHLFDSQNLTFWSENESCYVCYFRVWDGVRRIARSTSKDFVTWDTAVMMNQVHDDGSGPKPAPVEHLYTNQTSPYFRAPHIYLAIAARFFEGRQVVTAEQARSLNVSEKYFQDTSDAVFMSSRGGNTYDRAFLEGFLKPGIGLQNWVSRTNYPALNVIQTSPNELSFYANQDYAQPTAHVRRYSLRLDGFSSLHAGAREVKVATKPFRFNGSQLRINFATSAGGGIKFGLEDVGEAANSSKPIEESLEQIGNEIERTVTWKNERSVTGLAGRTVRMQITLRDADLYSFQFAP